MHAPPAFVASKSSWTSSFIFFSSSSRCCYCFIIDDFVCARALMSLFVATLLNNFSFSLFLSFFVSTQSSLLFSPMDLVIESFVLVLCFSCCLSYHQDVKKNVVEFIFIIVIPSTSATTAAFATDCSETNGQHRRAFLYCNIVTDNGV